MLVLIITYLLIAGPLAMIAARAAGHGSDSPCEEIAVELGQLRWRR